VAAPLVSTLTAGARRAFPIIERGVREGLSSTTINKVIRDTFGAGVRRTVLLEVMRGIRGVQLSGNALRSVRLDRIPSIQRLPESVTRMTSRYAFTFKVRGVDAKTGNILERFVTYATNEPITRGEMEAEILERLTTEEDYGGMEVDSLVLESGKQRPGG
jgi:hypothetical protein